MLPQRVPKPVYLPMPTIKMEQLVSISPDRAALDRIARPDAALAIWWRNISEPLRGILAAVDLDAIDDLSVEVATDASVAAALHSAGYPEAAGAVLSADIDLLVRRHAALTGEDRLRVCLNVIETDASSHFRADYLTLRLLCTYVGPGTEWCCVQGQDAICEVPTGSVAVFKGRMLLNPPAVLHRSPPIVAMGARRLELVIDPVQSY